MFDMTCRGSLRPVLLTCWLSSVGWSRSFGEFRDTPHLGVDHHFWPQFSDLGVGCPLLTSKNEYFVLLHIVNISRLTTFIFLYNLHCCIFIINHQPLPTKNLGLTTVNHGLPQSTTVNHNQPQSTTIYHTATPSTNHSCGTISKNFLHFYSWSSAS